MNSDLNPNSNAKADGPDSSQIAVAPNDGRSVMQAALDSAVGVSLLVVMLVVGLVDENDPTDASATNIALSGIAAAAIDSGPETRSQSNAQAVGPSTDKSNTSQQSTKRLPDTTPFDAQQPANSSQTFDDRGATRRELVSTAAISQELLAIREELAAEDSPVTSFIETLKVGEVPEVTFFGTTGVGESVVWIVDQSGSMAGEAFEAARLEVLRSMLNLKGGQRFNVVFFDNNHQYLVDRTLRDASPSGKAAYMRALIDYELGGGGTNPEPAVRDVTETLKPNIIYLLSDGAFKGFGTNTIPKLKEARVTVHTIGFRNKAGEARLTNIAKQTSGTYRFVPAARTPQRSTVNISRIFSDRLRKLMIFSQKLPPAWRAVCLPAFGTSCCKLRRCSAADTRFAAAAKSWKSNGKCWGS